MMLVVAGDSHTFALADGVSELDRSTADVLDDVFGSVDVGLVMEGFRASQPFFTADPEGVSFTGSAGERFARLLGGDGRIRPGDERTFGFCFGLHLFGVHPSLLGSSDRWRQHSVTARRDRLFVSMAAVEKLILHHGRFVVGFAETLNRQGVRAFFIGPPAVRGQHLTTHLGDLEIDEALSLQRSFWCVMEAALERAGIPCVLAPEETSAGGMLRPEFAAGIPERDTYHANGAFGRAVWRRIADLAASGAL